MALPNKKVKPSKSRSLIYENVPNLCGYHHPASVLSNRRMSARDWTVVIYICTLMFIAVAALRITRLIGLHQFDKHFPDGTTIFAYPISPTRIAIPMSLGYILFLVLLRSKLKAAFEKVDPKSATKIFRPLTWMVEMTVFKISAWLCAFLLAMDVLLLYVTFIKQTIWKDMYTYQAGNMEVELAWAGFWLLITFFGAFVLALGAAPLLAVDDMLMTAESLKEAERSAIAQEVAVEEWETIRAAKVQSASLKSNDRSGVPPTQARFNEKCRTNSLQSKH